MGDQKVPKCSLSGLGLLNFHFSDLAKFTTLIKFKAKDAHPEATATEASSQVGAEIAKGTDTEGEVQTQSIIDNLVSDQTDNQT